MLRLNALRELVDHLEEFDWEIERREPDEEMLKTVRCTVPAMRLMMGL
jgi:hypothetical protein